MEMCTTVALLLLLLVTFAATGRPDPPSSNWNYPVNALLDAGRLFPLGGLVPEARVHATVTVVSSWVVVFGGYRTDGSLYHDVQAFDTRSRTWTGNISRVACCDELGQAVETMGAPPPLTFPYVKTGFAGDVLPLARAEHSGAAVDGVLYVFGGVTQEHGLTNDLWKFDPGALTWTEIDTARGGPPPSRRAGHAAAADAFNHVFYVFGGRSRIGGAVRGLSDVWLFNATSVTWTLARYAVRPPLKTS